MAINIHPGSWSVAGIRLPDFGVTEAIGRVIKAPVTAQGGSNIIGSSQKATAPSTSQPINYGPAYNGPQSVNGVSTSRSVTGGGGGQAPQMATASNPIQDQLSSGNDQIERDYQNFMTQLSGQEQALRDQAPISQQKIEAGYAPATTAVKEQQASKLAGLDTSQQTVETQRQSQLQQARDLYRQIQQQNIAQLSGQGISSSSVAEALAENLGVETARRIAASSQSADDVIRQINQERVNVNDFTKQKLTDIETQKAAALAEVQNQFAQGLNQINQARQIAANDKANRRQDLLSQAQQAAAQIESNAQSFQQSLQLWQAQTQSGLANAANQDWSSIFGQLTSNLPQIGTLTSQLGQVGLQPSFDISNGGKLSMSINSKKKQDDPTAEAF